MDEKIQKMVTPGLETADGVIQGEGGINDGTIRQGGVERGTKNILEVR